MKNGIYIATRRVPNPVPGGHYEGWTNCAHLPPEPEEWEGTVDQLKRFILKVEDVLVLGRRYQWICWASPDPAWRVGYFVGDVPEPEHFPNLSEDEFSDEMKFGRAWAEQPAPQEFLDALVPAPELTVDEILTKYEGADGATFRDRSSWDPRNDLENPGKRDRTIISIMRTICDGRSDKIQEFESHLRMHMIHQAQVGELNGVAGLEEEVRSFLHGFRSGPQW